MNKPLLTAFLLGTLLGTHAGYGAIKTVKMYIDPGLLAYKNLEDYVDLSGGSNAINVLDGKLSDLTKLVSNMGKQNLYINGVYSGHVSTSTKIFDETGKKVSNYGWAELYMRQYVAGTLSDCPSYDASVTYYNRSFPIGDITGVKLLAPRTENGTFDVPDECGWVFRDTDGFCRAGTYSEKRDGNTYYEWNAHIVPCDKQDLYIDGIFDIDFGPLTASSVPGKWNNGAGTDMENRLSFEYGKALPSIKPFVDAAKTGEASGLYTFRGGYMGHDCSITYNDGIPVIGNGCYRVYNDDGSPTASSFTEDSNLTWQEEKKLILAWEYSVGIDACPTTTTDGNCILQQVVVTTQSSAISPTTDCGFLCKDTLGNCYLRPQNVSSGMVTCDIDGDFISMAKPVNVHGAYDVANGVDNIGNYLTWLPNTVMRAPHTVIYVQPNNKWPNISNLVNDLYHCHTINCTESDGKVFAGVYTEPDCKGTKIYDQSGSYVGPAYAESKIPTAIYICWE